MTHLPSEASVKVMRSYDYCHFEICLSAGEGLDLDDVDAMRKAAARLADKAVAQYKVMKIAADKMDYMEYGYRLEQARNTPENERTPQDKAIIKYHADESFRKRYEYDYEDEWGQPDDDYDGEV